MQQGTADWLTHRHNGIGGSDVAAIMGCSPYKTILQLYEEKILSSPPEFKNNHVMEKGTRTEPLARSLFEIEMDFKEFPPVLAVMDSHPFMRVSLDGWNKECHEIVEFKYTGKDKKIVPPHYMAQVQMQLLVTQSKICHYQSYDVFMEDGIERVRLHPAIKVLPDINYQMNMLERCIAFWNCVTKRVPPGIVPESNITNEFREALIEWKSLKVHEARIAELEKILKSQFTGTKEEIEGVKFSRQSRAGNIEYSKIPELQGINLEPYRKPNIEFIKMEITK